MALITGKVVLKFTGMEATQAALDLGFDHIKSTRKRGQKEYIKYTYTNGHTRFVLFENMLEIMPEGYKRTLV